MTVDLQLKSQLFTTMLPHSIQRLPEVRIHVWGVIMPQIKILKIEIEKDNCVLNFVAYEITSSL